MSVMNKNGGTLSIRLIIIVVIRSQNTELKRNEDERKGRIKRERM